MEIKEHGLPRQIAMGDSGTISTGLIRLGLPGLLEGFLHMFPLPGILINPLSLLPQLSLLDPVWAQYYLTPFSTSQDYIAVYDYPSINNSGFTSFGSWTGVMRSGANALISGPHQNQEFPYVGAGTPGFQAKPMVADSGQIVLQNGNLTNSPIFVADPLLQSGQQLTDDQFAELGPLPGISDDGQVVAFVGTHGLTGAGLYVSVKRDGRFQPPVKLLGVAGDGQLDFGEQHVDANHDGVLQRGEDVGPYASFDTSQRIGVNLLSVEADDATRDPQKPRYSIGFVSADPAGVFGLYNVAIDTPDGVPQVNRRTTVYRFDQPIPDLGTVTRVATNDPLNTSRELVFWAESGADRQAIVVAHQDLGDVLLHRFGSAGTADNLKLPRVELDYEIQASTRRGDAAQLAEPLFVGLYASQDDKMSLVSPGADRYLGEFEITADELDPAKGIVRHELDRQLSNGSTLKSPGSHRLTLNPSRITLRRNDGSTLLMDELAQSATNSCWR